MNKTKQKFRLKNKQIQELQDEIKNLENENTKLLSLLRKCNKFIITSKQQILPGEWWNIVKEIGVFFENNKTNKE